MAQSAVVRDYRALAIGEPRANRLVLTVSGGGACGGQPDFAVRGGCCRSSFKEPPEGRSPRGNVGRRVRSRSHRRREGAGLCATTPAAIPIAPLHEESISYRNP